MLSQIPSLWECLPGRVSVLATRHEKATTMDDAKLQIAHAPLDDPELPQELDPDFYREALLTYCAPHGGPITPRAIGIS